MPELPPEVFAQVEAHCAAGDAHAAEDRYDEALSEFRRAWELVPEPREDWAVTLWLLGALGDVHYLRGAFADGKNALADAVAVFPEAKDDPFVCLRLGQCHLELGDRAAAQDWLERAGQLDGDIFEEEDPKYLEFLESTPPRISGPMADGGE